MAQIIAGQTNCQLCGKVISSKDDAVAFPAFVPQGHEFTEFSDSAFHQSCFLAWEHHDKLQALYVEYQRIWKSRPTGLAFEEIEKWGKKAFPPIFEDGMLDAT